MTKEMVSVRIPKEMNKELTQFVSKIGITKNAFILSLLRKELVHSDESEAARA